MLRKFQPGCPCCEPKACENCSGEIPTCLQVTFSGFTNKDPAAYCTTCDCLNDAFLLQGGTGCVWACNLCNGCGGLHSPAVIVATLFSRSGRYYLEVDMRDGMPASYTQRYRFEADLGETKPDCTSWSGVALALVENTDPVYCDGTAATCSVTSLDSTASCENDPPFCHRCGNFTDCGKDTFLSATVVVSGITQGISTCTECPDLDGTYQVQQIIGTSSVCGCTIVGAVDPPVCGITRTSLTVSGWIGDIALVTFGFFLPWGTAVYHADATLDHKPIACSELSGLVLDFWPYVPIYGCRTTGATATIVSVDCPGGAVPLMAQATEKNPRPKHKPRPLQTRRRRPCNCGKRPRYPHVGENRLST